MFNTRQSTFAACLACLLVLLASCGTGNVPSDQGDSSTPTSAVLTIEFVGLPFGVTGAATLRLAEGGSWQTAPESGTLELPEGTYEVRGLRIEVPESDTTTRHYVPTANPYQVVLGSDEHRSLTITYVPEAGTLSLEYEGLPDGFVPRAHVQHPNGEITFIEGASMIEGLAPGTYDIAFEDLDGWYPLEAAKSIAIEHDVRTNVTTHFTTEALGWRLVARLPSTVAASPARVFEEDDGTILILQAGRLYRFSPKARWLQELARFEAFDASQAARMSDGRIIVTGGYRPTSGYYASRRVLAIDPRTGNVATLGPLIEARGMHSMVPLPDGRLLITGGDAQADLGSAMRSSVEIYDPERGSTLLASHMSQARTGHASHTLDNGSVLVIGGYSGGFVESAEQIELIDPVRDEIQTVSTIDRPVIGPALVRTATELLILGGMEQQAEDDIDAINLATLLVSKTPTALRYPRGFPAARQLSDGRILVTGGAEGLPITGSNTAELIDIGQSIGRALPNLPDNRVLHTSYESVEGDVFVIGGDTNADILQLNSELLNP